MEKKLNSTKPSEVFQSQHSFSTRNPQKTSKEEQQIVDFLENI